MLKFKNVIAVITAGVLAFSMAACGGTQEGETPADAVEGNYSIGIIKMMDHDALNKSEQGFVDALEENGLVDGENVTIDYKNGQGDTNNLSTIADQFVADGVDLVFAIATPAAQAIAGKTTEIPIVGTAITSYTEAQLADSDEAPGRNITGTTDMNPIEEQIRLIQEICPDASTIGFLYSSNEDNSVLQVNMAKEVCQELGLPTTEQTISSTNEIQQAVTAIVNNCDAIYIPTDNKFASSMPIVGDVANAAGIPVFCAEQGMVETGGFATLGIDYYSIGYQAGLMAVDILVNGKDPASMPIQNPSEYSYCFNGDVAEAIGVKVPDKYAEYVISPSEDSADADAADADADADAADEGDASDADVDAGEDPELQAQ